MKISLDVWSDVACPWCWIGKRRLEGALSRFGEDVDIHWRAFELDPSAPRAAPEAVDYAERLARKYGSSVEQAKGMIDRMTSVAAEDGLTMRFDRIRPGNTFDAHRLLHLAHERGVQNAVKERLFEAYFEEGQAPSDREMLVRVSAEAGLDAEEVEGVLASDAYAKEVRADEAQAARLGISGVPFFVIGGRYGVSGAQPVEVLLRVLEGVREELGGGAQAGVCGPDGCA